MAAREPGGEQQQRGGAKKTSLRRCALPEGVDTDQCDI